METNTTIASLGPKLKAEAKQLYIEENYTARAISLKLGVSEKSIGKWIKENGWKEQRNNPYQIKDAKVFVKRFQAHLSINYPSLYLQINQSIIDFLIDYKS